MVVAPSRSLRMRRSSTGIEKKALSPPRAKEEWGEISIGGGLREGTFTKTAGKEREREAGELGAKRGAPRASPKYRKVVRGGKVHVQRPSNLRGIVTRRTLASQKTSKIKRKCQNPLVSERKYSTKGGSHVEGTTRAR